MKRIISIVLTLTLIASLATGCGGRNVDKEAGYDVDRYIKLGDYTGFDYEIDQAKYDDLLEEKKYSSGEVNRPAKKGDEIEFSYTGYIKGEKVKDLSQKDTSTDSTQEDDSLYKKFYESLIGKKKGDTATVYASGKEASTISKDKKTYTDNVTFKLKVIAVDEVEYAKITDKWVAEESGEEDENGNEAKTTKDFYDIIDKELEKEAKADLWQKTIDSAEWANSVEKYPQKLYKAVEEEEVADANYQADQFQMSLDEYYTWNGYPKKTRAKELKKEYENLVKSTLVMWAIVSKENIKVTNKDIEKEYKRLYKVYKDENGYKSVDDVKEEYSRKEIKEAIYLEKAQNYVYDHSNVKKTYKGHKDTVTSPYDNSNEKEKK